MINPHAKLKPYLRLMALVVILGAISAVITFAFIALVSIITDLIWEKAQFTLGMDSRIFTVVVCTIGGLLVGLLVKIFGDHNAIFAELMQEFGKTGRFNYRHAPGIMITAFISLVTGGSLGPEAPLRDLLQATGLTARIGEGNIHPSVRAAVTAYHTHFSTIGST